MSKTPPLRFFNPRGDLAIWANRLPHWQQSGAVVFLTFRLADSLPKELLAPWQHARDAWRAKHPPPWSDELEREYHREFSAPIDRWLDAGHGECVLRDPACARVVGAVFEHDDANACHHLAWVVMPNHVHAIFALAASTALDHLVKTWKGVSARRINARLHRRGPLWQRDYFDRLVRDEEHLARCVRYIRRNPEKAGLQPNEYLLFESEPRAPSNDHPERTTRSGGTPAADVPLTATGVSPLRASPRQTASPLRSVPV